MTTQLSGADVTQLRATAVALLAAAEEIERVDLGVDRGLDRLLETWRGPDSTRYRERWDADSACVVHRTAAMLRHGGCLLLREADEQERTSADTADAGVWAGLLTAVSRAVDDTAAQLKAVTGAFTPVSWLVSTAELNGLRTRATQALGAFESARDLSIGPALRGAVDVLGAAGAAVDAYALYDSARLGYVTVDAVDGAVGLASARFGVPGAAVGLAWSVSRAVGDEIRPHYAATEFGQRMDARLTEDVARHGQLGAIARLPTGLTVTAVEGVALTVGETLGGRHEEMIRRHVAADWPREIRPAVGAAVVAGADAVVDVGSRTLDRVGDRVEDVAAVVGKVHSQAKNAADDAVDVVVDVVKKPLKAIRSLF